MTPVIRTSSLTKHYGRLVAVDRMDLEVREGDLFGFLGPNGSGKTTTVRMLLGLVFATRGDIEVLGRRIPRHARDVLGDVGVLVEAPAFYPHLSGVTNLKLLDSSARGGRSSRRRRVQEALERVGLAGTGRRPVKAYSSGMRQRLGLAGALLRPHRLLVLDEPTNGLDPHGMHEIRSLLTELASGGTTVFLSSHLLGEVELVCNRTAIVHRGRLVAQDSVARLLAPTGRLSITTPDPRRALGVLERMPQLARPEVDGSRVHVRLDGLNPDSINAHLVQEGVRVSELVVERRSLEQVYLDLTNTKKPPDAPG